MLFGWIRVFPGWLIILSLISMTVTASAQGSNRVILGEYDRERESGVLGGNLPASQIMDGCIGYISDLPNFILEVDEDAWVQIIVTVLGEADATLMLTGNGVSICNDDASQLTSDPAISTFLVAGEYYLYVGRAGLDSQGEYEIRFRTGTASERVEIHGRRTVQLSGMSGGDVPASRLVADCPGNISQGPNHILSLRRSMYLELTTESSSDLVLLVVGNQGALCNDDALGTLDARIAGWFPEGIVRVHVGSHNPRVQVPYTLSVRPVQ